MNQGSFSASLWSKWTAWIIVIATAIVYAMMMLVTIPHLTALNGGRAIFDMRPAGYSFSEAMDLLSALGGEGRQYYLNVQQRLDTLFPLLDAATAAIGLTTFIPGKSNPVRGAAIILLAAPCALLDWGENWAVARLLTGYPDAVTPTAVSLASGLSIAKSIWVTVAYSTLLIALVLWMRQKFRQRKS
jgi:hypothetical protein